MKWVPIGLAICVLLYQQGNLEFVFSRVGFCLVFMVAYVYVKQENILYASSNAMIPRRSQDNPVMMKHPSEWKMNYENVNITASDGVKLHGWFIPRPNAPASGANKAFTILYFHGNAGNVGSRLPFYANMHNKLLCNVLAVDYRGYGESEGEPSEQGLVLDAQAALAYLHAREDVDSSKVIVFGRSLGGAVAIALAHSHQQAISEGKGDTQPPLAGLIVENTFTCIAEVAGVALFVLRLVPIHLLQKIVTSKWLSCDRVGNLALPILFISGLKDAIIPPPQMAQLYALCKPQDISSEATQTHLLTTNPGERNERASGKKGYPLLFRSFAEGGHNDTPMKHAEAYTEVCRRFLEVIVKRRLQDKS